jgi:DNA-binding transcriptional LysR family regulator
LDRLFTMHVFLQVIDTGSFTAAARSLDISNSLASRAVAQLEAHLRVRLLHRSTRKVTATEAGTEFAERCREILTATAEAEAQAGLGRANSSGSLRVALPSALALAALAPLVAAYYRKYPEVSIDVTLIDRPIDLIEEGYDVAIVIAGMLRSDDVITRQVRGNRFIACCTPTYLQGKPPSTYAQLRDHHVLCLKAHAKKLTAEGCTPLHVSNNTAMLHLLAREGMGIAFLPGYLVAEDLNNGTLTQVLAQEKLEHVDIHVAYPSRRYVPSKVVHFVEMSLEYLSTVNIKSEDVASVGA